MKSKAMQSRLRRAAAHLPYIPQLLWWVRPASGDTIRWAVERPKVFSFLGHDLGVALEVGFGGALYTSYLADRAASVVAVDFDPVLGLRMQWTLRRYGTRVSIVHADAQSLPFETSSFDTVLCTQVLEHLDNGQQGLDEMARVLKSGGRLVLSVPLPVKSVVPGAGPGSHKVAGFDLDAMDDMLQSAGLEMVRYSYCFLYFSQLASRWLSWCRSHLKMTPLGIAAIALCQADRLVASGSRLSQPYILIIEANNIASVH